MKQLVDCFSHPGVAVIRNGPIEGSSRFDRHDIYIGEEIAGSIDQLRMSSDGFCSTPRTAGNLILGFLRNPLISSEPYRTPDPVTKLGRAVVTAEHVGGLQVLGVTHADNRRESRLGICNDLSIVSLSQGEGRDLTSEVWRAAQRDPTGFVATLNEQIGDGLPAELKIGVFATYNPATHQYKFGKPQV